MCDDVLCCCVAVKKGRSGQVRLGQSKTIKVKNSAQPLVSVNSIAIACSAYVYVSCVVGNYRVPKLLHYFFTLRARIILLLFCYVTNPKFSGRSRRTVIII